MSIIYTETLSDKDSRIEIDIGDGRMLTINIIGEGLIMDVYEPGFRNIDFDKHIGTVGMMFDEWADWIVGGDFDDGDPT
jgi:hypothetical protein